MRALYTALRQGILGGRLPVGSRLPSSRTLAAQQGLSRSTVVLAYEQLLAEGYVHGRRGSGTYVAPALRQERPAQRHSAPMPLAAYGTAAAAAATHLHGRVTTTLPFDFAFGGEVASFPLALWNRMLLRSARRRRPLDLDYGPAAGDLRLRETICTHLRRSRGVRSDASRILIVNGSQQALDLVTRVLIDRGERIAIEDPAYQGTALALRAAGARLSHVPVDRHGIDPARLPQQVRCVFVTPSHQFPTGATLPLARRLALLAWARRSNAIIIEDDYDGEFRYDGQPLESLQGLDEEARVVYVGTFSRTIFPSLRIGYLVVPSGLMTALTAAKWLCDRHTAHLEQLTLAEFIGSGAYERHLRQLRRRNAARRQSLMEAIERHLGDRVEVTGDAAGTHIVLWPHTDVAEQTLITRARARGVGVYGIASHYHARAPATGLMLGYARLDEQQIVEGVRRLARVL